MPVFDYKWEEDVDLSRHAPFCKNKNCQKAHYRDGAPKRRMVALVVVPDRERSYTWIWFCDHCKTIRDPMHTYV